MFEQEHTAVELEILSVNQAANLLHVSKGLVYKAINGKIKNVPKLPHIDLGRKKLIRRNILTYWLEECEGSRALQAANPAK